MQKKNISCKKIALEGNLVFQDACMKQKIKEISDSKEKFIELDFSKVETLDSMGVDLVVKMYKKIQERNGELRLSGVRSVQRDVLELCGLQALIRI